MASPLIASTRTASSGAPGGYDPAYGGIPQVPNLIDVYGTSLGANKQFLPQATALGSTITGASEEELLNNLRMALPGYDASVGKSMSNIGALQRGEIPADVRNQITQQAAERGIATGLYESPNANAALLSALGLTSLGLQGEGEKQMSALVGRTPQAQPFDVSKLLMSPTDLYESQLLANIYKAAPVPAAAARSLISDQMAGYGVGRRNVPTSFSSGAPSLPALTPMTPGPAGGNLYAAANPPAVGALGPFAPAPAPYTGTYQNLQAGGPGYARAGEATGWQWDEQLGMFVNNATGEVSDNPAAGESLGLASDYYTPAEEAVGQEDFYFAE